MAQLLELATQDNMVIAVLAICLVLAITANVVQYVDYRKDRGAPWLYVKNLTATLTKLELTMAILMERAK